MPIASPARWRCCSATRPSAPGGHKPGRRSPPRAQVRSTPCWTASRRGSMRSPRWHLRKCRRRHCAPAPMRAPEFWHARSGPMAGLAAGLLAPLGAGWDAASRLRRALARPYRASVPVICVGNLVAGGSGKTPVVLALAASIAASGVAVHIVTRGYGGRLSGPVRVDPAGHDAGAVGDEALLLARRSPCWVARHRSAGVRAAIAAGAGMVLLDDGFQNTTIAKTLSLVVVDAAYGFGNGRVIPAGPLRESLARGLARAQALVLLGAEVEKSCPQWIEIGRGLPVLPAVLAPVDGDR